MPQKRGNTAHDKENDIISAGFESTAWFHHNLKHGIYKLRASFNWQSSLQI